MSFEALLAALSRFTAGKPTLAVIGAMARNAWAPPRMTSDLDLAIAASPEAVAGAETVLRSLGYRRVREAQTDPADNLPDLIVFRNEAGSPIQIDFLVAKTPFEEEVLARAIQTDITGVWIPVATPEDLIVYKLIANRLRDRDDILAVLHTQARSGRRLDWDYIEKWAAYWEIEERAERLRNSSLSDS